MPASLSTVAPGPLPSSSLPPHPGPPSSSSAPPSSILIVGSGVFGLSTAYALSRRPAFAGTSIIVVDRSPNTALFPSRDASSVDTSRIIRADYADPEYAALAAEALVHWRTQDGPEDLGSQGRYEESSFVLVADTPETGVPEPSSDLAHATKKTALQYVRDSWENVLSMAEHDPGLRGKLRELPNPSAIRDAVGTGGSPGDWGYINETSGWADADASMKWLLKQVKATGRVTFVSGTVVSLEHSAEKVTGARLADDRVLGADLVVLATGAWTGSLVDLTGRAVATGQVLGYIDLTEEEQAQLSTMPVVLNLTSGLFIIPPRNRVLKAARHAYGYLNPTAAAERVHQALPSSPSTSSPVETVSLPWTHLDDPDLPVPAEGEAALRQAIRDITPLASLIDRPFSHTRLCWYTDTPTGDFLIDYHPAWKGLFLATGGSGHGFKFLPVIGEKIVDCLLGSPPTGFAEKWAWKAGSVAFKKWDEVITEDGSRGGKPGLILRDEMGKARSGH